MREMSSSLRGVPSGLVASQRSSPSKPTTSAISSASSRIVTSVPEPMLMFSLAGIALEQRTRRRRRGRRHGGIRAAAFPMPQTTISSARRRLGLVRLAHQRGEDVAELRSKLSPGP